MSKVGALIIIACGAAMAANAYAAKPRATQEIRAASTTSTSSSASTSSGAGGSGTTTGSMSAPEIDPGTAFSALTLLGASVAVLRGRRRK
jgi:hypothetical protein